MSDPRDSAPAERPQPLPPAPGGAGWPDLPGWARGPDTGERRVVTPTGSPPPVPPGQDGAVDGEARPLTAAEPAPRAAPASTSTEEGQRPVLSTEARADTTRAGSLAGPAAQMQPTGPVTPVSRGPRRARLAVRRVDPWSVLRFSFIASLALLVVFLVAVIVLYAVLAGMHVFSTINDQLHSLTGTDANGGLHVNFSFGRVLGISLIIGAVNVVLFTAIATLGAFVYNLVADLVGGIEVTLSERD
ncbi:MAG: DUF3566 domain-containing protein [Actinomycetes bacterium]